MSSNLPGVIKRVPFSRAGIATVSCVVTAHRGAWVVGHCIQVVHCIYCNGTEARSNFRAAGTRFLTACFLTDNVRFKQTGFLKPVLTAVFRSKLPQVQILHGEVDESGQFTGSSCLREAFQVWTESQGAAALCVHFKTFSPVVYECLYRTRLEATNTETSGEFYHPLQIVSLERALTP